MGQNASGDNPQTDSFTLSNQYFQGFETDNAWGDPATNPTRVASGTNGIASKTGGFHAEAVEGNFTRWGGYNAAFPAAGYTTSIDIYLDVNGAYANDTRFDYTSAINNAAGAHRRDFIFNAGFYNDSDITGSGPRFVVSASNNAPGNPKDAGRDPFAISASGWYTFQHRFYNNGAGVLAVQLSIINSANAVLHTWTLSDASDVIGSTVGGNRYGWFPTMDFPFLAVDNSARANVVQDAPVVVKPGNLNGWAAVSQRTATGTFTKGPGTPPLGFGGYRMTTGAGNAGPNLPQGGAGQGGKTWLTTQQFSGTSLSSITELRYSTYVASATSSAIAPSLQFQVDIDGNGSRDAAMVYEPVYSVDTQGPIVANTWQTWNARTGKWWFTNNAITTGAFCPLNCFNTYSDIIAAFPNAKIVDWFPLTDGAGVQFVAGQNSAGAPWINFDGNIDAFTIGIAGNNTAFNFEPTMTTVIDDDGMASAASCDDATPASNNIADGVLAATAGDNTVRVCPGTYLLSSSVNLNKAGLTILGVGAARPVISIPTSTGYGFTVTAPNVTLENLEIAKADLGTNHNMILVNANNFTAQNNLIYGPNPGGTWNATSIVSRAFEVAGGLTGLLIQNNTINTLRQPAYINTSSGQIIGNNVSGTKGWVVDGANLTFSGNTWGEPQNQDCDIALLASVNPANYTPLLALSANNDNAFVCAQFAGGENGRAVAYVDDNASPNGNGSDNANYQSITSAINGTLTGGTVQVGAGGYNEDVTVNKSVVINGAGVDSTTVTGPIGGPVSTFTVAASNVEIRKLKITRAGNNTTDWNDPNLNTAGVAVQGTSVTGLNLHDTLITGNRTGVDINNSNGHTLRNNVITDNRTGLVFRNQTDNLTVVENEITNNWTVGVIFIDASGGTNSPVQTALNSTFFNNNISGNWYGQIVDRQTGGSLPAPGTTNLKNFGGNWLGTTVPVVTTANSAEPGYAAQIPVAYGGSAVPPGGQPDLAGAASGNIDFSPFLYGGADTNVQTAPGRGTYGFQGSFNALGVSAASPQANGALSNIQEGINLVTAGGTLNIQNGTYAGNVNINKVLTLKGTPTILGTLTTSVAGARISPGFSPGIINSGSLSLISGSFVDIEINGATAGSGYDQINVTGTVSLGGATLNVTNGFTPSAGNTFTIINNDGADAVTGTFNDLPEGTVFFVGANSYRITYMGGDGNDVVLTSVSLCNTVSIPSGITTPTGTTVNVPVGVDDVTGKGLLSIDTRITYNPSVINTPSVSLTPLTNGRSLTVNTSTPGLIIISVYGDTPMTGSGVLLNIAFNVVGSIGSTSGVNFNSFMFNEGTPCLSTSNGSVNVVSGTVSGTVNYAHAPNAPVPGTNLNGAGSVNVSTSTDLTGAYNLSGFGAGAYTVTASKSGDVNGSITSNDSARIAQHVASLVPLNATQLVVADVSDNGSVTSFDAALIARYAVLLPNSGSTGTWRFAPASRNYASVASNFTGENYTAYLMGDVTGNWTTSITMFAPFVEPLRDEDRVKVIMPKLTAADGSLVTVPVGVADLTGKNIVSYQFDVVFDPQMVEPAEALADVTETLSSRMTVVSNVIKKDTIRVAVYGALPLEGKGTLLNLKLKVSGGDGSSSPLKIENFVFNENTQLAAPVDGEIKVSSDESVAVEGQLLTPTGAPIGDAEVVLTDSNGKSRSIMTGEAGLFRFGGLTAGETYTVSVNSKRYTFTPQAISPADGIAKLNLIAEP